MSFLGPKYSFLRRKKEMIAQTDHKSKLPATTSTNGNEISNNVT